jgi:hypothetical protein
MVCIFDPACELLPPMEAGTILYLCTVAYGAWRAGTSNRVVVPACQAGGLLLGSL